MVFVTLRCYPTFIILHNYSSYAANIYETNNISEAIHKAQADTNWSKVFSIHSSGDPIGLSQNNNQVSKHYIAPTLLVVICNFKDRYVPIWIHM